MNEPSKCVVKSIQYGLVAAKLLLPQFLVADLIKESELSWKSINDIALG